MPNHIPYWARMLIDQTKEVALNPDIQKQLREVVLDPFFDVMMEKMFPYVLGFLIIFIGTFLVVICVLILLFRIWMYQK